MKKSKPILNIYACGGAGINLVTPLLLAAKGSESSEPYADTRFLLADTSHANLKHSEQMEHFFHVEDPNKDLTDGSGMVRGENMQAAKDAVVPILLKQTPGDMNVLVTSASGASGAAIVSALTVELLARKENVCVVLVEARDSTKAISNALAMLGTLKNLSAKAGRPIPVHYLQNNKQGRHNVDDLARMFLLVLSVMYSGQVDGVDRADLKNFFNYTAVSNYAADVCEVGFEFGAVALEETKNTAYSTVLSLVEDFGQDTNLSVIPPFHKVGAIDGELRLNHIQFPIHVFTRQGSMASYVTELEQLTNAGQNQQRSKPATFSVDQQADSDGILP